MDRQTLKKIETGCNCSFWKLGVSQTVFQISFMLLFTWAIECSRLRDNRVRGIEKAQTLRVFSTIWEPGTGCTCNKVWETCLFDKKLWLCHSQAIDLFTDTAAILNLLVLRSIMGCPGGYSLSIYARRELHCLFLGKKAITITSKHRTTIFFSHYNRDFKIQRRGRQGERQKTIGFRSKTTLHVHHTFLYISLPVFARLRRENA